MVAEGVTVVVAEGVTVVVAEGVTVVVAEGVVVVVAIAESLDFFTDFFTDLGVTVGVAVTGLAIGVAVAGLAIGVAVAGLAVAGLEMAGFDEAVKSISSSKIPVFCVLLFETDFLSAKATGFLNTESFLPVFLCHPFGPISSNFNIPIRAFPSLFCPTTLSYFNTPNNPGMI